jgi:hypothetical protein
VELDGGGSAVVLTFSGAVAIDAGGAMTPDFAFHVGEQQPESVAWPGPGGPASVVAGFPGGVGAGDAWSLDAQPNWLVTPVAFPTSGAIPV